MGYHAVRPSACQFSQHAVTSSWNPPRGWRLVAARWAGLDKVVALKVVTLCDFLGALSLAWAYIAPYPA